MNKICTSIEQSKILAEFLPLESADMYFALSEDESTNMICLGKSQGFFDKIQIAWSLAALLDVLPPIEGFRPIIDLDINLIRYEGNYRDELCFNGNNLIDACYEMIIKLKKLNLL